MLVLFHQSEKFTAKISPKISRMEPRGVFHVKNFEIVNCFLRLYDKKTFDGKCFLVKKIVC